MAEKEMRQNVNPLETESIGKLMWKYSLPAIISSLVGSIYNVVDQIYVGNKIGEMGTAATNVVFPLVMIATTFAMTFGTGSAASFSLYLGQKKEEKARNVVGSGMTLILLFGLLITAVSYAFMEPLLIAFGGRGQTLEYAIEYTRILAAGFPLVMLGTGAGLIIRADGSPMYAMAGSLTGLLLNCVLDPIFIFGLNMNMAGAALATIISQFVAGVFLLVYFFRFKTFKLKLRDFILKIGSVLRIVKLGVAAGASQVAITLVSIVLNNTLGYYGELSIYGRDIAISCVGIASKIDAIFNGVVLGIAQSIQPVIGYNYGAKKYARVKEAFKKALSVIVCISLAAFLCYMLCPKLIVDMFGGGGDALYYEFAEKYFRIFKCGTLIAGTHILCSQLFSSIGKGGVGTIVSISKHILFLIPLELILPLLLGMTGVLISGPLSDLFGGGIAILLAVREIKKWKQPLQTEI